jgi:hypothetical protein
MNGLLDFLQGASNSAASNVSAPIDGINWLLRKAGLPVSEAPLLGSDWMAQQGLTREPQNRNMGLLGDAIGGIAPIVAAAKAPQIAKGLLQMGENAAIPQTLSSQAGMIKTPFGRIPETSKEIDGFYDQLQRKARALGYPTNGGSSNVSGSRYLEFSGKQGPAGEPASTFQVRLSNHGDRYPNASGSDARFSVDPDSRNTFEMAKEWLKDNGFNLDKRVPKVAAKPHILNGTKASELQVLRSSRGARPVTAADVKAFGLIDDLGLLGN